VPENGEILSIDSANGFSIIDVMVANSSGLITTNTVEQFALLSSYPNPFNPETTISFELFADSNVDLAIFNMVGQRVSTLMSGFYDNGYYDIVWNGTDLNGTELASGIYMVKLITDNNVSTNKITLLK
jgi:flagellar hook assembly protein FlgD